MYNIVISSLFLIVQASQHCKLLQILLRSSFLKGTFVAISYVIIYLFTHLICIISISTMRDSNMRQYRKDTSQYLYVRVLAWLLQFALSVQLKSVQ